MKNNLTIIGVGASCKTLECEKALFAAIPMQTSATFLVSWTCCVKTGNHLAYAMKQACRLPVRVAVDGMGLEPGVVYLNAPGHILTVEDGKIRLRPVEAEEGDEAPVEQLLASLGAAHQTMGVRTLGVLLDGDCAGGLLGLARLRQAGGVSILRVADEELRGGCHLEYQMTILELQELFRSRSLSLGTLRHSKGEGRTGREGGTEPADAQKRLDDIIRNLREEKAKLSIVIGLSVDIIFEYDIRYDTMLHSSQEKLQVDVPDFMERYSKNVFELGLVLPEDREQLRELVNALRQGRELSMELRIRYNDGAYRYTEIVGSPILNTEGKPIKVVGRCKDIHARKLQEEYLLDLAKRDSLTNLYNKETIRRLVVAEMERLTGSESGYLLLVDVDKFKHINDTYGHLLGDGILCSIARALAVGFGTEALLGRIGGDEFMLFCRDTTEEEIFRQVEHINANLYNTYATEKECACFSVSVGASRCTAENRDYENCFRQADCALYRIKECRKDKVMVYDSKSCGTQLSEFRSAPQGELPVSYVIDSGEKLLLYVLEVLEKETNRGSALNLILSRAGTFLGFHDFILAREVNGQRQAQLVFHWQDGSRCMNLEKIPLYPDLQQRLDRGESVCLTQAMLQGLGHEEIVSAFLVRATDSAGHCYAGFLDRREDRDWLREEKTLRSLAGILADSFQHGEELVQLELNRQRFELALDCGRLRYWEWDIRSKRLFRSARVRDELGLGAYVDGVPEVFVENGSIHPDDVEAYLAFYRGLERGEGGMLSFRSRQLDGSFRELSITYRVLFDKNGEPDRALGIGRSGESRPDQEAYWRSEVAGLYNQMGFFRKTRAVLDANPGREFLLMLLNVDNFKVFNDLFGRGRGDELIAHIGRAYRRLMEEDSLCVCAHFYGDSFAMLCLREDEEAERRLYRAHEWRKEFMPGYEFQLSAGLYVVEEPSLEVSAMCDRARLALRHAKARKERAVYYDESLLRQILLEQDICNDFEAAMAERRIVVHMQPQYNIATGEICGAEALARWTHPVRGLISPLDFIPVLEKTGKVTELDLYVARQVCRLIGDVKHKLPPLGFSFSINVSRTDVYSNIIQQLETILEESGLSPDSIRLEITETAYVEHPERVVGFVRQLQSAGFQVEMDDFGSGYSSLNALKDIAVDALKLDMLFLSPGNDQRGNQIIAALIAMAHSMNTVVVAEGVETEAQAQMLREAGCDVAQGYYYSRPLPVEQFLKVLYGEA